MRCRASWDEPSGMALRSINLLMTERVPQVPMAIWPLTVVALVITIAESWYAETGSDSSKPYSPC